MCKLEQRLLKNLWNGIAHTVPRQGGLTCLITLPSLTYIRRLPIGYNYPLELG